MELDEEWMNVEEMFCYGEEKYFLLSILNENEGNYTDFLLIFLLLLLLMP